jgi:hypothetical protein
MARSAPRDTEAMSPDPNLMGEVIRALHQISEGLAGYTRDLGALSNGYKGLEQSLTTLTQTVNEISVALRGSSGPGLVATQVMHRQALDQICEELASLKREVVRIDPNAKTRADWFRWMVGLLAMPALGLMIWFAAGWTRTGREFERSQQRIEWVSTDLYKRLDDYKIRIEQLERRRSRPSTPLHEPGE